MAWLPVETLIFNEQQEYYRVLGECDRKSDCTAFISFMLDKIQLALKEGIEAQNSVGDKMSVQMSVQNLGGLTRTAQQLMTLLTEKPTSNSAELAAELNLSVRTIERNLKVLQDKQKIKRIGATKNGHWILL